MSEWRTRAEITSDVVLFHYVTDPEERESPEVYVWDLDKTYLDTTFETFRGLVRTVREKAFQKRNVPGTATLVRALRDYWQETHLGRKDFPIYFITGSPPQLESKIHDKLAYDGIYPFGLFCKDNLQNLRPGRLWRLTQQVGYKLQALLQLRLHLAPDVRQILWGDDSEMDAVIYSLYSDLCARRLEERDARQILKHFKVIGQQVDAILMLLEDVPKQDPVEKIYINLAADTDADYYLKFGRRILPTYNTFQLALDLYQDRRLSSAQVVNVARDLVQNFGFGVDELEHSLEELIRRPVLADKTLESIVPVLSEYRLLPQGYTPAISPRSVVSSVGTRIFELEGVTEPWVPEHVDYMRDDR
ncbi:MAG: phosphatase domain-containing protein [Bdellovibrionales bacterium]